MKHTTLPLEFLQAFYESFQIRVQENPSTIATYAQDMLEGVSFPPISVVRFSIKNEKGQKIDHYVLADGWHRVKAAEKNKSPSISAEITQARDKRDAVCKALDIALSKNRQHGLPMTRADKHKAVKMALTAWPDLSNRAIAQKAGVSDPFVAKLRPSGANVSTSTRTGADGKSYPAEKKATAPKRPTTAPTAAPATPAPAELKKQPVPAPKRPTKVKVLDKTGLEVPAETIESFSRADATGPNTTRALIRMLRDIRNELDRFQTTNEHPYFKKREFAEVDLQDVCNDLMGAIGELKRAMPYAVCIDCNGKRPIESNGIKCGTCKGKGWVSRFFWNQCNMEDSKKVRLGFKLANGKWMKDGREWQESDGKASEEMDE
jgi:hypothetical protein